VDLSEVKTERIQGAQRDEEATPRGKRLKDPLEKLVNLGAEAIAVDVDAVLVGDVQSPEPSDEFRVPGRLDQVCRASMCMPAPSIRFRRRRSPSSRARLGGAWI
jgi:hypothetical protein